MWLCRPMAVVNSLDLSRELLQDRLSQPAQYGALVWDDPIIRSIPQALWDLVNATDFAGLGNAGGLLGALPLLAGSGVLPLPLAGLAGSLTGTGLLSRLGTGETRVLSRMVARFRDNPGAAFLPDTCVFDEIISQKVSVVASHVVLQA